MSRADLETLAGIGELWESAIKTASEKMEAFDGATINCTVMGPQGFHGLLIQKIPFDSYEGLMLHEGPMFRVLHEAFRMHVGNAALHRHMLRDPEWPHILVFRTEKERDASLQTMGVCEPVFLKPGTVDPRLEKLKGPYVVPEFKFSTPEDRDRKLEEIKERVNRSYGKLVDLGRFDEVDLDSTSPGQEEPEEASTVTAESAPNEETVNHPQHYGGDTTYETIKVMRAWYGDDYVIPFCLLNAVKYLSRAGKKGGNTREKDYEKSIWYLNYAFDILKPRPKTSRMYEQVAELHRVFNQPRGSRPLRIDSTFPTELRTKLIQEESRELVEALESGNVVNSLKELADLLYVVFGTAVALGVDPTPFFDLVHDNNMSKLGPDGKPIELPDLPGRFIKPEGWKPPDIRGLLDKLYPGWNA